MIYLDNNSTTPVSEQVIQAMLPWFTELCANPASLCSSASPARKAVEQARQSVADLLGVDKETCVFTSGATESNCAVFSSAWDLQPEKTVFLLGATEHSSVEETAKKLAASRPNGECVLVPVNKRGEIVFAELEKLLGRLASQIALVSIHWANNETGVIQEIEKIAEICARYQLPFHVDAAQAFGKIAISLRDLPVHFISFSAHKMGGPQGIGGLYIKRGVRFSPLLTGGGQENQRRSGTLNVAGIVGFGEAAKLAKIWLSQANVEVLAAKRDLLESSVVNLVEGVEVNGKGAARLPNTTNLLFSSLQGEALRLALDVQGLCCSAGSACRSEKPEPSTVLLAMGRTKQEAKSSLRFSLPRTIEEEEIQLAIEKIVAAVEKAKAVQLQQQVKFYPQSDLDE